MTFSKKEKMGTIKRKTKECKRCGRMRYIFSKGNCEPCARIVNNTKLVEKLKITDKKQTISELEKELDLWFSRFIRLRDTNENGVAICCTCGKPHEPKNIQCGHYISRSSKQLRWSEINAHAQDIRCNVLLKGNYTEYSVFMVNKYGSGILEELQVKKAAKYKADRFALNVLIDLYKEKVSELIKEKNVSKWW